MNIKKVLIICIVVIFIKYNLTYVFGNEVNIYQDIQDTEVIEEDAYESINSIMNEIAKELRQIDGKLDKSRVMDTYEKYPLIRLNIDAPYFGIAAITESKLNVKDSVSTLDIARGYNIRSIINSKTILVENIEVTGIVISTKNIKISRDMTKEDGKICLEKLIFYLQQAKNANKFVDIQLKNTFKEYYSQNKNLNIMYIRNEINNVDNILKDVEDKLMKISLITTLDTSENLNKCNEFKLRTIGFEDTIKDPMIEEKELENCVTDIIKLKGELLTFSEEVNLDYDNIEEININTMLQNALINMNENINFLKDEERFPFIKNDEEKNVFSNRYMSSIEKYQYELSELLSSGRYNNQDLDFSYEQIEQEVNKIYATYLNFLNTYNSVITQYIKYVVTNIKQTGLENLKINTDLLYIYTDLDEDLIEVSNYFEKNNAYNSAVCINKLKDIAIKVCALQENIIGESK